MVLCCLVTSMVCRIKSKNACGRTAWGFFVTTSIPCDGITAKRLDTAIQLCSSKLLQMLRRRSLVVPFFASASFSMSSLSLKSEQDSFGSITACIQIRMEGCWPGCGCTRGLDRLPHDQTRPKTISPTHLSRGPYMTIFLLLTLPLCSF